MSGKNTTASCGTAGGGEVTSGLWHSVGIRKMQKKNAVMTSKASFLELTLELASFRGWHNASAEGGPP